MNICIPVTEDSGLNSPVSAHFGSAPMFLIVDTETNACTTIVNQNQHHGHGGCSPLQSLTGHEIDGIVVGGIGMGAIMKLRAAGITVFMAAQDTVGEAVAACVAGKLKEVDPLNACAHHGHGHDHGGGGCGH